MYTRNIDTCNCPIISHIYQCRAYSSVLVTQVHHVVIKLTNNVPHLDTGCTVECFYRYTLDALLEQKNPLMESSTPQCMVNASL